MSTATAATPATATTSTGTLVRYEWRRTRGLLGVLTGLATMGVLICTALVMADWTLFSTLASGIGIMLVMAFTPGMQIALAVDYWRSSYGATAYLTHTLPVKGGRIFAVKMLWAVVVTTVSLLITFLLGCVLYAGFATGHEQITGLGQMFGELGDAVRTSGIPAWMLTGGLVLGYLACMVAPVQYYFAISLGKERRLQTMGAGGPVLVFIVLMMVSQVVALVGMFLIPLGVTGDGTGWTLGTYSLLDEMNRDYVGNPHYNATMPLGFVPPLAVLVLLCLWRTVHSWNRRIELE